MTFRTTGLPVPPEGELVAADVDGAKVALAAVDGQVYAVDDACTHRQCSLSSGDLDGRSVVCPCHLGRFDLATGQVLEGPPPTPVRTWRVRVVDGVVEVAP